MRERTHRERVYAARTHVRSNISNACKTLVEKKKSETNRCKRKIAIFSGKEVEFSYDNPGYNNLTTFHPINRRKIGGSEWGIAPLKRLRGPRNAIHDGRRSQLLTGREI